MAIQLPDVGTGVPADQTGDSPWLAMKKVRENFADQTNAASKLLGTEAGQIPLAEQSYRASYNRVSFANPSGGGDDFNLNKNEIWYIGGAASNSPSSVGVGSIHGGILRDITPNSYGHQIFVPRLGNVLAFRTFKGGDRADPINWESWVSIYHTGNTSKDSNGFIKAASPIVKVFADKVELNDDAERQNVSYKKNGIGDYTITTISGLSTDGWYIELPKDMNGNPKVAVTLSEVEGVISLKTYKRIFSMETFTFEPDLDNPLDIPDGRWIDLRLNEIPVEAQEELPTNGG